MDPVQANARKALHALLAEFEQTLQGEYDALLHRDASGLESAVANKQRLTHALGEASLLGDFENRQKDHDPAAQGEWKVIEDLLGRCARANQTNGAAVTTSKNFVGSLLDVLRGRSPRDRLYDARGRTGHQGPEPQARERV